MEINLEANILQSVFPEEIWLLIAEKVQDTTDFQGLCNSSLYLQNLFRELRLHKLFSEVAKVLFCESDKLFPSKHGKIAPDLLNCRLVCRTWETAVDSVLQSAINYSNLLYSDTIIPAGLTETKIEFPYQPEAFLKRFGNKDAAKNRNPFIGRNVRILCCSDTGYRKVFTPHLMKILSTYGQHIWRFSLCLFCTWPAFTTFNVWWYERLRDVLQLMPNLKVLEFCSAEVYSYKGALVNSPEACVFPELKNLKHLVLQNVPRLFFDVLLRSYSHVSMLSNYVYRGTSDMWLYTHKMPNLRQADLSLGSFSKLIQWNASSTLWPLKTLIICLEFFPTEWQPLFQFLEQRLTMLTEFKIDFQEIRNRKTHPNPVLPCLNLPNLQVFVLETKTFVPLDFILPTRNCLKRLAVRYTRIETELESEFENENQVKLFKFRRNLRNSNIWRLFTKLQTVEYYDIETQEQLCHRPIP